MIKIPWYMNDIRFEPGTVADIGHAIRLSLHKVDNKDEYRLYLQVRTIKKYNGKDDLKLRIRVATFKKCSNLQNAQNKANEWFAEWATDILNDSYV